MIAKGKRFYHKHWLDTAKWDGKTAQVFEVTRATKYQIYYRPVYTYSDGYSTRQELGKGFCSTPEYFEREALGSWL